MASGAALGHARVADRETAGAESPFVLGAVPSTSAFRAAFDDIVLARYFGGTGAQSMVIRVIITTAASEVKEADHTRVGYIRTDT